MWPNTVKPTRCRSVCGNLPNHLKLSVEDNGCGLDFERLRAANDAMSGNGLANMRDRAEICGGSLEIKSNPQAGTAIHLTLPLH